MLQVSGRITIRFDIVNSPSLTPGQRELILRRLQNRIGKDAVLRVISQQTRSQAANRELAVERFVKLMREASRKAPVRKKKRVSRAAKLRRLDEKRQRSVLKHERSKRLPVEE